MTNFTSVIDIHVGGDFLMVWGLVQMTSSKKSGKYDWMIDMMCAEDAGDAHTSRAPDLMICVIFDRRFSTSLTLVMAL